MILLITGASHTGKTALARAISAVIACAIFCSGV